jgi:diadenosine tetraphosphate (Ap4A) HIT family hydrolase
MTQQINQEQLLYEDALLFVELLKTSAILGQVKIVPKKAVRFIENLSDEEIAHFFNVSSYVATAVFEALGAHGTNIMLSSGFKDRFEFNVFPRSNEDGINFTWDMKPANPDDLEKIKNRLLDHTSYVGIEKPKINPQDNLKVKETQHNIQDNVEDNVEEDNEEDYRIRSLNRIP